MKHALSLIILGVAFVIAGPGRAETRVLGSTAASWEDIQAKPSTNNGRTHALLKSPTATLDELEIHITTLPPGQASHEPHKHPNEEVIIVKEGTVEAFQGGQTRRLGPGSVMFMASNQLHAVRNVGEGPATYHVINWFSPGMKKAQVAP
jgi:quercetin dioxygenase-like cupin family protein